MKKHFILSGLLFAAIMLVGSNVWAQWNTTGSTTWTNNNVEIRGDRAFMQDGFQVARIHKGGHATAFTNTYLGADAGSNSSMQTVVGYRAGAGNTGGTQAAFGFNAGLGNLQNNQSVFGYQAGYENKGDGQVAFGYRAGFRNEGDRQFAFGFRSGFENTGDLQVALGYEAGYQNTGNRQVAYGYESGRFNTGHNQSAFGFRAGRGNSGANGVFIGYEAGLDNATDNQFIVQHTIANATPLLQGNFATGELHINGPLYANGKITTKEVEVTLTGWPDFVFDESYDLMSLNDIEDYVNTYRHLPGVPNEFDVHENGVNLGEMSAILLQKIEELTLYMIALNKQNEELRQRIDELEQ